MMEAEPSSETVCMLFLMFLNEETKLNVQEYAWVIPLYVNFPTPMKQAIGSYPELVTCHLPTWQHISPKTHLRAAKRIKQTTEN